VRDLPYVGVEFGRLRDEPHTADAVFRAGYGDCKDKATLLRALLRAVNIDSQYVLVRTADRGHLDRDACGPDEFNHVILRAELPAGPIFLDPSVEHAPPGVLAPTVAGADALLVRGDGELEWDADLAMEFRTADSVVPWLVTVDATYSTHPETLAQKHIYFHTLRSKLWPDQPEEEWDYPVCETWAIYPSISMTDFRAVQRMHAGELGLLPGERAGERVAVWFDGILTRLGIELY
jgi:hypothetical protein